MHTRDNEGKLREDDSHLVLKEGQLGYSNVIHNVEFLTMGVSTNMGAAPPSPLRFIFLDIFRHKFVPLTTKRQN